MLISEGDAFLTMHLWELYQGLGQQVSDAVRSFRRFGVTAHRLNDGSWRELVCEGEFCPQIVDIITTEIGVMSGITEEIELEFGLCFSRTTAVTEYDA
jgi:hypothetical protein